MKDAGRRLAPHGSSLGGFDVPPAEGRHSRARWPPPTPVSWLARAGEVNPQTARKQGLRLLELPSGPPSTDTTTRSCLSPAGPGPGGTLLARLRQQWCKLLGWGQRLCTIVNISSITKSGTTHMLSAWQAVAFQQTDGCGRESWNFRDKETGGGEAIWES